MYIIVNTGAALPRGENITTISIGYIDNNIEAVLVYCPLPSQFRYELRNKNKKNHAAAGLMVHGLRYL